MNLRTKVKVITIIVAKKSILWLHDFLKFFYLKPVELFINKTIPFNHERTVFLIKTDEIGDYLLFRNLLFYLKSCKKFASYRIVLCGNIIWENLADNLDQNYIDEFVWLEKSKFSGNLIYRFNFLKTLSQRKPEILVNCCYSRSYYIDDTIASVIQSKEKIAFQTDLSNSYKWQIKLSDKFYSLLINSENEVFELYKNRLLFEKLLNTKIDLLKPTITLEKENNLTIPEGSFAVFFIGGKRNYKKWKLNYYKEIAEYIIKKYNLSIYFVGTESESKDNQLLIDQLGNNNKINDLSGNTSLIELASILKKARLLVSNDSGIVHLAASVNTKTIVILNGTHFGRFLPYPEETGLNISALYPHEISKYIGDRKSLYKKHKYRSILDINTVSPMQVKDEIDKLLLK